LRLTGFAQHKKLAINALQALAQDQFDEAAMVARAKVAMVTALGGESAQYVAEFTLPAGFIEPNEEELQRLLKLADMPVKPTWDTVPATDPAPPDRNPRTDFTLKTAADLSAGNGAFMRYAESLGLDVQWYAETCDVAAAVAAKNVNPTASRYRDVNTLDPAKLPKVDLLMAGISCQPWSKVGLQLGFKDSRVDTLFSVFHIAAVMQPKAIFLENVATFASAAKGKVWQFVCNLARLVGFEPALWSSCASLWQVPQVRKRAFMVFLRKDISGLIGPPTNPADTKHGVARGHLGRRTLEELLLPYDQTKHLVVPDFKRRVNWVRNPDLTIKPLSDTGQLLPIVAGIMDGDKRCSNRALINFIPAVKASTQGLGGSAHLVAQRVPGTVQFVVRHLHVLEVIAMQEAEEWDISLFHSAHPEQAISGIGNSCPARLFLPHLKALTEHCKPVSLFVPLSFE
jgi:hypothetical protein